MEEEAALDFEQAEQVLKDITIARGSLDEGFAEADRIVEGVYRTGHQE